MRTRQRTRCGLNQARVTARRAPRGCRVRVNGLALLRLPRDHVAGRCLTLRCTPIGKGEPPGCAAAEHRSGRSIRSTGADARPDRARAAGAGFGSPIVLRPVDSVPHTWQRSAPTVGRTCLRCGAAAAEPRPPATCVGALDHGAAAQADCRETLRAPARSSTDESCLWATRAPGPPRRALGR